MSGRRSLRGFIGSRSCTNLISLGKGFWEPENCAEVQEICLPWTGYLSWYAGKVPCTTDGPLDLMVARTSIAGEEL